MAQTNAASGYPTEIDVLDAAQYPADPDPGALKHSKVSDALAKVEAELGTTPSGAFATVREAIESKADSGDMAAALDTKAPALISVNTQTGTGYTLTASDAGRKVETNNASANTITVPANATASMPVGTVIGLRQYGGGQTTVVGATGVAVRSRGSVFKLAGQYAEAALEKRATDEWILSGDISA